MFEITSLGALRARGGGRAASLAAAAAAAAALR